MKEFVKKLIGRLEELRTCSDFGTCNHCQNRWCPMELLEADEVIKIVNQLAEEYNNGWIPCSERLPNKEEYLKDDGRFIVTDGNRIYMTHFDIYETQKFGVPQLNGFCEDKCVVAWQPLPAPFQKGE